MSETKTFLSFEVKKTQTGIYWQEEQDQERSRLANLLPRYTHSRVHVAATSINDSSNSNNGESANPAFGGGMPGLRRLGNIRQRTVPHGGRIFVPPGSRIAVRTTTRRAGAPANVRLDAASANNNRQQGRWQRVQLHRLQHPPSNGTGGDTTIQPPLFVTGISYHNNMGPSLSNAHNNGWLSIPIDQLRPVVRPDAQQGLRQRDDSLQEEQPNTTCAICYDSIDQAVSCGSPTCTARYCRTCLRRALDGSNPPRCPVWRTPHVTITPDVDLQHVLETTQATCRYAACNQSFALHELKRHEQDCPKIRVACALVPYGCAWKGPRHAAHDCPLEPLRGFLTQWRAALVQRDEYGRWLRLESAFCSLHWYAVAF